MPTPPPEDEEPLTPEMEQLLDKTIADIKKTPPPGTGR